MNGVGRHDSSILQFILLRLARTKCISVVVAFKRCCRVPAKEERRLKLLQYGRVESRENGLAKRE